MHNNNNIIDIYSIFSGTFYEIPEKDVELLNIGQIPLLKKPSSCKKCYGKGHSGRDVNTLAYQVCPCVRKNINFQLIKKLNPELNNLK
jgi:hypothetical protein